MATALLIALALLASDATATASSGSGEPLPPGAPTDEYELTGWCFGALGEYLDIYDQVKPDLIDIDRIFGSPVKESEPYASDIAGARAELKVLGDALEAAEKASPRPIAPHGAAAIKKGQGIWAVVESRPHRELARAWLTWGLPDQCAITARTLITKSKLLGKALTYNTKPSEAKPLAPPPASDGPVLRPIAPVTPATPAPSPAPAPSPPADVAVATPQPHATSDGPSPAQSPTIAPPTAKPSTPVPAPAQPAKPSDQPSEPIL